MVLTVATQKQERKSMMERVKCPKCGSTAQPKHMYTWNFADIKKGIAKGYRCGCGCTFEHRYALVDIRIKGEK